MKAPPRTKQETNLRGVIAPAGVILADLSAQAPNNSYAPPMYYEDQPFTCVDCGTEGVWTAEQQWQYFEVWKKDINHRVIRCGKCQGKRKHKKQEDTARMYKARQERWEAQQSPGSDVRDTASEE